VLLSLDRLRRRPASEILGVLEPAAGLREVRVLLTGWLEHALERRFRAAPALERELLRGAKGRGSGEGEGASGTISR
jgi:hypothetical protein